MSLLCLPPSVTFAPLSLSLSLSPPPFLSLPLPFPASSLYSLSTYFKVLHDFHGTLPTGRATSITSSSSNTLVFEPVISEHLVTSKVFNTVVSFRLGYLVDQLSLALVVAAAVSGQFVWQPCTLNVMRASQLGVDVAVD